MANSFNQFRDRVLDQIISMSRGAKRLFVVDLDKDELWNLYLDSFPPGANEIYRVRRVHDCSACRQFVKGFGNVVAIDGENLRTVWDVQVDDPAYQTVANALSAFVKSKPVVNVFFSRFPQIGTEKTYEQTDNGVHTWEHLWSPVPMISYEPRRSIGDRQGEFRSAKDVFKRSLDEISLDSIDTVLELISSNTLYRGTEWKAALNEFRRYKTAYQELKDDTTKNLFAWSKSIEAGGAISRIRNHSIGVLLMDIDSGMDLDAAVRRYEQIVAPVNYKRPKAIFTKRMLDEAQKTIEELGYMNSLGRRFATLDDITANNILFANKDSAKRIANASIFDEMRRDVAVDPKKFSRVEEIEIEDFVSNVLPTASEIELLMEARHERNMMSLIAPLDKNSKSMFKWNNGFSWAYAGNITDSDIRQNVKSAGGDVNGVLRFSIQWNDGAEWDRNDLDAHCVEPSGNLIYYGDKFNRSTGGRLDVDIINPQRSEPAVENITWPDKARMRKGKYRFSTHCFSRRGGNGGFRAEIEFDGQIFSFNYDKAMRQDDEIEVATIEFDGTNFRIVRSMASSLSSREIWNVQTNQFVPVSVICYSPNYWDEQSGIGNRHYFFFLKDCINPERPNGMFNEYLKEELLKHKRVFEALGSRMAVEDSEDQLSGVGFSSTRRNDAIVKVKGSTERVLKIKF